MENGINVLSLFDGISGGQMALEKLGIKVNNYYASEIDKYAIMACMNNYPNTIQLGDVRNVNGYDYKDINCLIGGSPCQSFSFSGKMKGMSTKDNIEIITLNQYLDLKEKGYEFEGQSYLFWEFVRILKEVKPKYFLLENVMMKEHWEKVISDTLGVEPLKDKNGKKGLNSNLVSAQNRKRLYWTNIPNIIPPEDKGITWGDIREHGVNSESYYYTDKAMQWLARHSQRKNKNLTVHLDNEKVQMIEASHGKKYSSQRFFGVCDFPSDEQTLGVMRGRYNMFNLVEKQIEFRLDNKTNIITTVAKDNVIVPFTLPNRIPSNEFFFRYITPLECVRAQTIPDNYFIDGDGNQIISNSQIYRSVGNGWTIDMIAHIFSFMIKNNDNK